MVLSGMTSDPDPELGKLSGENARTIPTVLARQRPTA